MTIRKLTEIIKDDRQDSVIDADKVREYVNALETRLCTEVFLTHENPPPGVYLFMGLPPAHHGPGGPQADHGGPHHGPHHGEEPWPPFVPHAQGYSDEWSFDDWQDIPLLVPPPYDDIYRAYIQWQTDLHQNDAIDASNSQRVYWQAHQDFAKWWNRTHMPINKTPYRGYRK